MILTMLSFAIVQVNLLHEVGSIEVIDYRETCTYVLGRVPQFLAMKLDQYSVMAAGDEVANDEENEAEIDWVALGKGRHEKKTE